MNNDDVTVRDVVHMNVAYRSSDGSHTDTFHIPERPHITNFHPKFVEYGIIA
jgi:hypothetical protein